MSQVLPAVMEASAELQVLVHKLVAVLAEHFVVVEFLVYLPTNYYSLKLPSSSLMFSTESLDNIPNSTAAENDDTKEESATTLYI